MASDKWNNDSLKNYSFGPGDFDTGTSKDLSEGADVIHSDLTKFSFGANDQGSPVIDDCGPASVIGHFMGPTDNPFVSMTDGLEFDDQNFVSAGDFMGQLDADEAEFDRENVFRQDEALTVNESQAKSNESSWEYKSIVTIPCPSWLDCSGKDSLIDISIDTYMKSRSEPLGDISAVSENRRPQFGMQVISPKRDKACPLIDITWEASDTTLSSSVDKDSDTLRDSCSRNTSTPPLSNKTFSCSTLGKNTDAVVVPPCPAPPSASSCHEEQHSVFDLSQFLSTVSSDDPNEMVKQLMQSLKIKSIRGISNKEKPIEKVSDKQQKPTLPGERMHDKQKLHQQQHIKDFERQIDEQIFCKPNAPLPTIKSIDKKSQIPKQIKPLEKSTNEKSFHQIKPPTDKDPVKISEKPSSKQQITEQHSQMPSEKRTNIPSFHSSEKTATSAKEVADTQRKTSEWKSPKLSIASYKELELKTSQRTLGSRSQPDSGDMKCSTLLPDRKSEKYKTDGCVAIPDGDVHVDKALDVLDSKCNDSDLTQKQQRNSKSDLKLSSYEVLHQAHIQLPLPEPSKSQETQYYKSYKEDKNDPIAIQPQFGMQVISPKRDKACPLIDITWEASDTTLSSSVDKDSDTLRDSCSRNTSTPPLSNKTFSCSTLGKNTDAVVVPPCPAPPSASSCHEEQHSVFDLSQFLSTVSSDDPNEMVKQLMQSLKIKSIRGISNKEKPIEKVSDKQQKPTLPGERMHDKQKLHQQQHIKDFERQIDEQIFCKPNAPLPTIKSIDKKSQIPKQIKPLEKSTNEKSFHQIKPPTDKDPVKISEKPSSKQQITEQHSQMPSEKRTNIPSFHSSEKTATSAKEVADTQRKTSEWKSPKLSIASYKELELKTSQRTLGSRSQPDSGDMKCSTLLPDRKSEKYKTDGCVAIPDGDVHVDKALDVLDSKCNDSDLTQKQQRNSKSDLKLSSYEVLHQAHIQLPLPEPSKSQETQYYKSYKEDKNDPIAIQPQFGMQVISPKRDKACPLIDITWEASDTTLSSSVDKDSDTLRDSCSRNTSTPPLSNKTFSCSTLGKNTDAVVVPPCPAPPSASSCHEEQHSVFDLSQFLSTVSSDDPNEMVKQLMQSLKIKSIRGISNKEKPIEKVSDKQQKPTLPGERMHDKQKLHQQQHIKDFERQIDEQIFCKPNAPLPTIKSIDKKSQIPKQIKPLEKSTNEKSFHQIKPPTDKDPVKISEKPSSKQQITEQHSQMPSEKRTNIPSFHSSEKTATSAKEVADTQRKTSEWKSPKLSIASYKELELKTSQRTLGSRSQPDSGDMKCSTLLPDRKSEKYKTDGCVAIPDGDVHVDKALDVLDSKCNDSDLTQKQQRNSKSDLKLSSYEVLHQAHIQLPLPEPSKSQETQYYKSYKEDKNDPIAIQPQFGMQVISPKRDKACPLIDITWEASDTTLSSSVDKDSDTLRDSCSRNTSTPPLSNKTFSCSTLGKNTDAVVVPPCPAPPSASSCHEEQHSVFDLSQFLSTVSSDDPNEMVKQLMQSLKIKSIRGISNKEKSIEKLSDKQQKPTLPGERMHDKQKLHQQQHIKDFERQIDEQIFCKPNAPLPTIKSIDKKSQIPKQIKPLEKSTNEKSFHQIKPPTDKDPVKISEKPSSKQQITEQHSQMPSEKRTNIPSFHSSEKTATSAKEVADTQRETSEWKSPKLSIASYKELELKTSQRTLGSRSQPDSGDMKCSTLLPDRKSEKYKTDGCVAIPDGDVHVDKALDVLDSKCNDSDLTQKQQRNSKSDLKLSSYEVLHQAHIQLPLPEPSKSQETQYYKSYKEDKNDPIAIQVFPADLNFGHIAWGSCQHQHLTVRNLSSCMIRVLIKPDVPTNPFWFSAHEEVRSKLYQPVKDKKGQKILIYCRAPSKELDKDYLKKQSDNNQRRIFTSTANLIGGTTKEFNNHTVFVIYCITPVMQFNEELSKKPPQESKATVQVEALSNKSNIIQTVNLRVMLGYAKLYIPADAKVLEFRSLYGHIVEKSIQLRNGGNIDLQMTLLVSKHNELFFVIPSTITIQPHSLFRVKVIFLCPSTKPDKIECLLLLHHEPDGDLYEIPIVGHVLVPSKSDPPLIFSDNSQLPFYWVPVGHKKQKIMRILNKYDHPVTMTAEIQGPDFQIRNNKGELLSRLEELVLPPGQKKEVRLVYIPSAGAVQRAKLLLKPKAASFKLEIPLSGYGGVSPLVVLGAEALPIPNYYKTEVGPVIPDHSIVKTLVLSNKGCRPTHIRTAVFSDVNCTKEISSQQVEMSPVSFHLLPSKQQNVTLVLQPSERELTLASTRQTVAVLEFTYTDEVNESGVEKSRGNRLMLVLTGSFHPTWNLRDQVDITGQLESFSVHCLTQDMSLMRTVCNEDLPVDTEPDTDWFPHTDNRDCGQDVTEKLISHTKNFNKK